MGQPRDRDFARHFRATPNPLHVNLVDLVANDLAEGAAEAADDAGLLVGAEGALGLVAGADFEALDEAGHDGVDIASGDG